MNKKLGISGLSNSEFLLMVLSFVAPGIGQLCLHQKTEFYVHFILYWGLVAIAALPYLLPELETFRVLLREPRVFSFPIGGLVFSTYSAYCVYDFLLQSKSDKNISSPDMWMYFLVLVTCLTRLNPWEYWPNAAPF